MKTACAFGGPIRQVLIPSPFLMGRCLGLSLNLDRIGATYLSKSIHALARPKTSSVIGKEPQSAITWSEFSRFGFNQCSTIGFDRQHCFASVAITLGFFIANRSFPVL